MTASNKWAGVVAIACLLPAIAGAAGSSVSFGGMCNAEFWCSDMESFVSSWEKPTDPAHIQQYSYYIGWDHLNMSNAEALVFPRSCPGVCNDPSNSFNITVNLSAAMSFISTQKPVIPDGAPHLYIWVGTGAYTAVQNLIRDFENTNVTGYPFPNNTYNGQRLFAQANTPLPPGMLTWAVIRVQVLNNTAAAWDYSANYSRVSSVAGQNFVSNASKIIHTVNINSVLQLAVWDFTPHEVPAATWPSLGNTVVVAGAYNTYIPFNVTTAVSANFTTSTGSNPSTAATSPPPPPNGAHTIVASAWTVVAAALLIVLLLQ